MTAHNHIKENIAEIKNKLILDTRNISELKELKVYRL
jgi:hypothetical protein